jgi:hypothetical protein
MPSPYEMFFGRTCVLVSTLAGYNTRLDRPASRAQVLRGHLSNTTLWDPPALAGGAVAVRRL